MVKHTVASILLLLTAAPHLSAAQEARDEFTAKLPDETTVELIGLRHFDIRYLDKSKGQDFPWWRPDGSSLPNPLDSRRGRGAGGDSHLFLFRVTADASCDCRAVGPWNTTLSAQPVTRRAQGFEADDLRAFTLLFPPNQKQADIKLGVATADWKVVDRWSLGPRFTPYNLVLTSSEQLILRCPEQIGSDVVAEVTQVITERATRLVVFDQDGNRYESKGEIGGEGVGLVRHIHRFKNLDKSNIEHIEFQARPYNYWITFRNVSLEMGHKTPVQIDVRKPGSLLVGQPIPSFDGINIEFADVAKGGMLLICFFDMNQRPSRHCITELAKQAEQLEHKGVALIAVQASKADENKLNEWVKENNIPFALGMIQADVEKTRFAWGVHSVPWLILTDRQHIVLAQGFALSDLDEKLEAIGEVSAPRAPGRTQTSERATLERVRELVARNEALINPIKVEYTVSIRRTGERQVPTGGTRRPGRPYSHYNVAWAQSGLRQYVQLDYFYSIDELARSSVKVFDDQVRTEAKLPDLMEGYVSPIDTHDWYHVLTAKLGIRPFQGRYTLSEILVPEHATLHKNTELVDNRQTYVVDAQRPDLNPYFTRVWIDRESGTPLRIRYYDQYPNRDPESFVSEVSGIRLYQLPNGGRIPIQAVRSLHFRRSDPPRVTYEHLSVDVNSITIRREDIPESLFRIEFPDGARIYNVISGLTTVKGRPLKTYEQVVAAGGNFIAGTVLDQNGVPVPEVVVGPCRVTTQHSDGQFSHRLIGVHDRPCAITDAKGRFAIELEQEGSYELWFFPKDFVDKRLRDVPLGEHDLKVTLSKGGTVTGRVVRTVNGQKLPVDNIEVTAEEGQQMPLASLRFGRMRAKTDSQGRFQIRYLSTQMPQRRTGNRQEQQYVPRPWQIRCGPISKSILFDDGISTVNVELVLKPSLQAAPSLVGSTLPKFQGLGIDVRSEDIEDQKVLLCFFDLNQRPSRHCITELADRAKQLKQKSVTIVAIQASKVDENTFNEWVKKQNIPFPVGMIEDDVEKTRFAWGVQSLPWLILTNREHVVRSEGFAFSELENKLNQIEGD